MIQTTKLILVISSISFATTDFCGKSKHADSISYESLYKIETKLNKNTKEYNTMKSEEMIKEENEKIIRRMFDDKEK